MSNKYTYINVVGEDQQIFAGLADHGEMSAVEMIRKIRNYGKHLREQADLIDSYADDDFRITVSRGVWVRHHIKTLQEGKSW